VAVGMQSTNDTIYSVTLVCPLRASVMYASVVTGVEMPRVMYELSLILEQR